MQIEDNANKMTPEQFVQWLQGFMEISKPESLTKKQTQVIKEKLNLVLTNKAPDYTITTTPSDGATITIPSLVFPDSHPHGCLCIECTLKKGPMPITCFTSTPIGK